MSNTAVHRLGAIERAIVSTDDRLALFTDPDFLRSAVEYLDRLFDDFGSQVLSFDVFDTVLLRNDVSELHRFAQIAERVAEMLADDLELPCTGEDALTARFLATRAAYRLGPQISGCREGTLVDIHRMMLDVLGAPPTLARGTMELELDYEAGSLVASPLAAAFAARARERDIEVILLSDMYMSAEQIGRLLDRVVGDFPYGRLISSADTKISKKSGLLYRQVAGEFELPPAAFLHIGDSFEGDYRAAVREGVHALYLPVPVPQRQRIWEDYRTTRSRLEARGVDLGTWWNEPSW